jgi:hypothetical protein
MKTFKTALSAALTAAVLMVPAAPASASEEEPQPVVECADLPDLSKWGWQWPC